MVRMVSDLLNPAGYAAQHLDVAFFLRFEAIAAAAAARPLGESNSPCISVNCELGR